MLRTRCNEVFRRPRFIESRTFCMAKSDVMHATFSGFSAETGIAALWSLAWCFCILAGVIQPSESESSGGGCSSGAVTASFVCAESV